MGKQSIIAELRSSLCCPFDYRGTFRIADDDLTFYPIEKLWNEVARKHVRGDEIYYLPNGNLDFLEDNSEAYLRMMLINAREWRGKARDEFAIATRRFTQLRYASANEYGKHLPPAGESAANIEAMSKLPKQAPVSRFYQRIDDEVMLSTFFGGIFWHFDDADDLDSPTRDEGLWRQLLELETCKLAFQCSNMIGACEGMPTKYLRYELSASACLLHAYPVSEFEARRTQAPYDFIYVDALDGFGRHLNDGGLG
jgi:hypothetical protein